MVKIRFKRLLNGLTLVVLLLGRAFVVGRADKARHRLEGLATGLGTETSIEQVNNSTNSILSSRPTKHSESELDLDALDCASPQSQERILRSRMPPVTLDSTIPQGKRTGYLSWDDYFLSVAVLSSRRSKDPSAPSGACIVNSKNRIVGKHHGTMTCCRNEEPGNHKRPICR